MKIRVTLALLLAAGAGGEHAVAANSPAEPTKKHSSAGPKAKTTELKKLRGEIQNLRSTLDSARGEQAALRSQLRVTEMETGKVSRSLKMLQQELQHHTSDLQQLRLRQQQQQANLAAQRLALAQQVRASYAMGHQELLKILLNQQDPAAMGRSLVYYNYFNRTRVTHIENVTVSLQELENLEQSIQTKTEQVAQAQTKTEQEKRRLEESRQQRSSVLSKLGADIQSKEQQLQRLLEDEQQLNQLLKRLQEAQQRAAEQRRANAAKRAKPDKPQRPSQPDKPNAPGKPLTPPPDAPEPIIDDKSVFASLRGKLPWPAHGPIAAHYGTSRKLGTSKWQGVLIAAAEGQEVRAISKGRVVFSDWMRGFGLLLIIDHGDGYMSLYGQNQNLRKNTGDWVNGGDVIASVGDSGGQMNPGLYFEIRRGGAPINPAQWCR
ncbi:MAG: peptidoglycan DD-metalloendopeptidase family protein [Gammaproteobacteria bacterium]